MLQCRDCEFFHPAPNADQTGLPGGHPVLPELSQFTCDPFSTIKEPECLMKWQLLQLNTVAKSHQATLDMYRRLAPLQEKMFKHMEREIDEADDADSWKSPEDDEPDDDIFRV